MSEGFGAFAKIYLSFKFLFSMKKYCILFIFFLFGIYTQTFAQGCVAIRQYAGCGLTGSSSAIMNKGQLQVSASFRYFKSYKHFVGSEEQTERVNQATNVINNSYALDITLNYALTRRLNINFTVPYVYYDRSSLYEHAQLGRFITSAKGIGDVRLGASYWMLDPEKNQNGNLALGLAVKLATGNWNAQDQFHTKDGMVTHAVDQSIQPGDGGFGFSVDIQGYRKLGNKIFLYGNAFYLFNPRETNNTKRYVAPGGKSNPVVAEYSVPDQYMARVGVSFAPVNGISLSIGGRVEGLPSKDIIGESYGFRRPGYIESIEPGLNYIFHGNTFFALSVPIAIVRNRTQSVADKLSTPQGHGDAAFADYSINVGIAHRFGK